MLQCSFSFVAAHLLVKMTSTLQKSKCCSATSAAQLSKDCSASQTSVFAGGMLRGGVYRNNRKGGTASLRSRTCVKRNAAFGARFKDLSLYFLYQQGHLIRIKTGLDTYLIRIQTRTPLSRYPRDCEVSETEHFKRDYLFQDSSP